MADDVKLTGAFPSYGIGRLGAVAPDYSGNYGPASLQAFQLDMIERRILRIEAALRRAGIEVEQLDLPA